MRLFFFGILIANFTLLFCEDSSDLISYHPYYSTSFKHFSQGHIVDKSQLMPGHNAAGRVDLSKNIDYFITASYLLFQPHEKGLIYAYSVDNPNSNKGKAFEMISNYKSGFKMSFGLSLKEDDWSFYLEYMRLHASKPKILHQRLVSIFSSSTHIMTSLDVKWRLGIDIFDLMWARSFYSGTRFILIPAFGIKAGWIDQKFHTSGIRERDNELFFSRSKSDSWLAGLSSLIKAKYFFAYGISIFGKLEGSLLYQNFKVKNIQNSYENPLILSDNSIMDTSYTNPNMNMSSGVGWGRYFFKKSMHFSILAGYEAQVFWNQNLMNELNEIQRSGYMQEAGTLYLHGLITKARFDF